MFGRYKSQQPKRLGAGQQNRPWCTNLDPPDANETLRELFDGKGKEERDGESHSAIERDGHKHVAGGQLVPHQDEDANGDEDDDLAGYEEGGHVEATQVGAPQDLGDFQTVE